MTRIALIINDLSGGGAERVFLTLARVWQAQGIAVHLIVLQAARDYRVPEGVTVHLLSRRGLPETRLAKRYAAWRLRRLVRRLQRDGDFRLMLSTLQIADEIAWRAGLPCWHRIANTMSAKLRIAELRERAPDRAARRLRRCADQYDGRDMVAISQGVADDLLGPMQLRPRRVRVIANPVDPALLRAAAGEAAALPAQPYIVHAARFHPQKRHDVMLDAFAQLDFPGRLVLLTKPTDELRDMVRSRGLESRVLLPGFQANPYPWIAGARLLALCSDWEGLGNVLLESLALGTPVVSTDCPSGPAEVMTGALARFLTPVGDAAALARAMADALHGYPAIPDELLARYAPQRIAQAYLDLAGADEGSNLSV
jgi:glycosyltransferase involved in cell wall biosynthesis